MDFRHSAFLIGMTALLGLTACSSPDKSQYWQRANVSESVYQRGPKAQQMLHRDISRCVAELRELERTGTIKNAIPVDGTGRVLDPDRAQMEDWDTPERDGHLYAEHSDYHDFESCMAAKGWERVAHLPYDVAEEARSNYRKAHVNYAYESRIGKKHTRMTTTPAPGYSGEFDNVNE